MDGVRVLVRAAEAEAEDRTEGEKYGDEMID